MVGLNRRVVRKIPLGALNSVDFPVVDRTHRSFGVHSPICRRSTITKATDRPPPSRGQNTRSTTGLQIRQLLALRFLAAGPIITKFASTALTGYESDRWRS